VIGDLLEKLDKTAAETLAGAENENGESDIDQDAIESATDSEQSATTVAYDPPASIPNGNSTTPKHQDSRLLGFYPPTCSFAIDEVDQSNDSESPQ
jgi:hypothetical protein